VNENLRDKQMNFMLLMYSVLAFTVLTVALYLTLHPKVEIVFQTPCAVLFFINEPTPTLNATFTYVPRTGYIYKPEELAEEMTRRAMGILPQFEVEFRDNRFVISCAVTLRVTDREYAPGRESIVNGNYVGARYGEAARFLNHLLIPCEISYPQYQINGQTFTRLFSNKSLQNARIGFDAIPSPPQNINLVVDPTNPQLLIVTWNAPPTPFYTAGIYLSDSGGLDKFIVNWDQVSTSPASYTYTDLQVGNFYNAAVSFIGRYDESIFTVSIQRNVLLPGIPSPYVFDILAGTTTSPHNTATLGRGVVDETLNVTVYPNDHRKIVDNSSVRWPSDLISYTQIKSVTIRFYANIQTSLPSDSRVTFNIDGPMFYYMYWRIIAKDPTDLSPFPYAFASTNASVGTTGVISPPLEYTELTITSPGHIENLFSTFGAGPQDVYLFYGYYSTYMMYNFDNGTAAPKIVTALSLTYV